MPLTTIQIPDYELRDLYHAMQFREKLAAGCLSETVSYRDVVPAKQFPGVSYHVTLIEPGGARVARIHYITAESGQTRYWPTYVRVGSVRIFRHGHQRPPWSRWRLRLRWEIGHLRRHIAQAQARAR